MAYQSLEYYGGEPELDPFLAEQRRGTLESLLSTPPGPVAALGSGGGGVLQPQVQDAWGRSPSDPQYNIPPVGDPKRAGYEAKFGATPGPPAAGGGQVPAASGGLGWWEDPSKDPFGAVGGGVFVNGQWVPKSHPLAQQAGAASTPTGPSVGVAGASGPSLQQSFSSALQKLLSGPSPQEAASAVQRSAPVTAFNANAKRNEARDRQLLAERAAAQGFSGSGALESDILGLRSRTNEAMDRFAGEQARYEQEGRREELMRALALALASNDSEAARALQRELGMEGFAVQRQGISTGRENVLDQLGYNYANLQNNMNQSILNMLFGGG